METAVTVTPSHPPVFYLRLNQRWRKGALNPEARARHACEVLQALKHCESCTLQRYVNPQPHMSTSDAVARHQPEPGQQETLHASASRQPHRTELAGCLPCLLLLQCEGKEHCRVLEDGWTGRSFHKCIKMTCFKVSLSSEITFEALVRLSTLHSVWGASNSTSVCGP